MEKEFNTDVLDTNDTPIREFNDAFPEDYLPHVSHEYKMPYIDREISWLQFNKRVLRLAVDDKTPLLEKLKFLSIANSNLDEFFSIRVASRLKETDPEKDTDTNIKQILNESREMLDEIDMVYSALDFNLRENNIIIRNPIEEVQNSDNSLSEIKWNEVTYHIPGEDDKLEKYFFKNIFPSLTPLVLDTTRPIPHLKPFSIYIAVIVNIDNTEKIGIIEVPSHLPRLISFSNKEYEQKHFFFIEDVIIKHLNSVFPNISYYDITAFRILRDGDSNTDEGMAFHDIDYVESMINHVRSRILYNEPVRVDIWRNPRKKILNMLKNSLDISKKFIFNTQTRLKMSDIIEVYNKMDIPQFKYPEFTPYKPFRDQKAKSMLSLINSKDLLVHHPYESFEDTVLRFVAEACTDPNVVSIKQTLYRAGTNSRLLKYLLHAAQSGKNVVVVMELKARFDEENNIEWAEKLKQAGAIVVYGHEHIKTHAKMLHVFKIKNGDPQQFVHIGTGNYSEKNSKIYTDFSYFTSNRKICQDVASIFNMITGGTILDEINLNHIKVSPANNRKFIYEMIDDQISKGKDGYIMIKVNNIADEGLTEKLYEASNAGVTIDIICRGSCSVTPGIEGWSENINVKSIIGRFLEHSRILQFGLENARVFITSSDMMTRNLDRRLELIFEITDEDNKDIITDYISCALLDNVNSYVMTNDGRYIKKIKEHHQSIVNAQLV